MKAKRLSAGELAVSLGCTLVGDSTLILEGVAPIAEARPDQLTFLANPKYCSDLPSSQAGACIVTPNETTPSGMTRLETKQTYTAFRKALDLFYPEPVRHVESGIHPTAVIHTSAKLGQGVSIGAYVSVAEGVAIGDNSQVFSGARIDTGSRIGKDCVIGFNVVIRHEVTIRDRVVIGDSSVVGFDGFGYAPDESGFHKIPQVGTVEISDDVEIGAGCCIDRATIGSTKIGRGSKLDNLIQIAHGVEIGENTVIAAQTGISGSTTIGSRVMIGGQAGFVGHIDVGDGMIVGAQAGITKSYDIHGMISGYPARPQMEAMRIEAAMSKLPELLRRVRELERKLEVLANTSEAG